MSIGRDLTLSPSKSANLPYFYIWNTRSLQNHSSDILYFLISFILEFYEMTVNFNCGNNFFVLPVVVAKAFSSFDAQRKRGPGERWWGGAGRGTDGRKGEARRSIPHPYDCSSAILF